MRLITLLLIMAITGHGQHLSASLRKGGLKKIIQSALKTYSDSKQEILFTIPSQKTYLKITKNELKNYPIIKELKKYVNFSLDEDFSYYIRWSPMSISFEIDPSSYKFKFEGESSDMDLLAKGAITSVNVEADWFELCEVKAKKCLKENGVYFKVNNFNVDLDQDHSIDAFVALNVKTSKEHTYVSNKRLMSSLFRPKSKEEREYYKEFGIEYKNPGLNIAFDNIEIPKSTLQVGDRVIELDTSGVKKVIINNKRFLAKQLLHIVGEFISKDLAQEITKSVIASLSTIVKRTKIFDYRATVTNGEIVSRIDGNYVIQKYNINKESFMANFISLLMDMVYYSKAELNYLDAHIEGSSIAFDYDIDIHFNETKNEVNKEILNGMGTFTRPSFEWIKDDYDVAIAIGEPFINAVLGSSVESGLVSKVFKEQLKLDGVNVKDIHLHFDQETKTIDQKKVASGVNTGTFTAVVELDVDLNEIESDGVGGWLESKTASLIEGGKIHFPFELKLRPSIRVDSGEIFLDLSLAQEPLVDRFVNSYNYPIKEMSSIVEKGVVKKINNLVIDKIKVLPSINISDYISLPGLKADPKKIIFMSSGHMAMLLDVECLELKKIVDYIGGEE